MAEPYLLLEQVFIHGKVRFNDDEWDGMGSSKVPESLPQFVGVYMRENRNLKLFRNGEYPVMRGLAYVQMTGKATRDERFHPEVGYIPWLGGPLALYVEVSRGQCDIKLSCAMFLR